MKTSTILFAGSALLWTVALIAGLKNASDLNCYAFIILGQIVFITGMHAKEIGD
jgi:hypothetical protein